MEEVEMSRTGRTNWGNDMSGQLWS